MASTGYRTPSSGQKDGKNGGHKKSSALGRFMSFIRKGKDKEHSVSKRGVSARQKSTDSGISSNRDTYINSDDNINDPANYSSNYNGRAANTARPCSTIKVVRNNSHIQATSAGKVCGQYSAPATNPHVPTSNHKFSTV